MKAIRHMYSENTSNFSCSTKFFSFPSGGFLLSSPFADPSLFVGQLRAAAVSLYVW